EHISGDARDQIEVLFPVRVPDPRAFAMLHHQITLEGVLVILVFKRHPVALRRWRRAIGGGCRGHAVHLLVSVCLVCLVRASVSYQYVIPNVALAPSPIGRGGARTRASVAIWQD